MLNNTKSRILTGIKFTTICTIMLLLSINVEAGFVYNGTLGEQIRAFSSRSLAMGSTGIASSEEVLNSLKNPAILGSLPSKLSFQFSGNLTKNDEDRSYPLYDSFSSYVDNAVYVSNAHLFDKYFAGVAYNFAIKPFNVTTAFNYAPLYDFNFKYIEEIRNNESADDDNQPKKIAVNTYESSGLLNSYSPAIAVSMERKNKFFSKISLGLGISILKGNCDLDSTIIFTKWAKDTMSFTPADSIPDVNYHVKRDLSGMRFQGGLIFGLGKRIELGVSYIQKAEISLDETIEFDSTSSFSSTIYYPQEIGFGIKYRPRNRWNATFEFDANYVQWSDYNTLYDDIIEYSAGIEYYMPSAVPLRLGFSYKPMARDKEVTLTTFSLGTSVSLSYNFILNLGCEIGTMNYSHLDLFPDGYYANENLWDTAYDPLPVNRDKPDNVEDFLTNFMATFSWKF
ncbi:MAG: outer membrane protein transport protein [Candidatus Cloacimonadota bacterium]|nr:outer membrane protein transport protein [Candidatus Cloacimonadota bacterium]